MAYVERTPPGFPTLVLLAALSVLSLNMFVPSLPHIAADFAVDYALASLAVAGYMATTAIMHLLIGPLSDRFGRRPLLLAGLGIFSLASIGCFLAANIWIFLGFRVLQSAIVAGWVLSLAIVRDTSEPGETASRIGYVTMVMAIGPMLGPMLGGALDDVFGWRANFACYALLGLGTFAWCWVDAGETNRNRSSTLTRQFHEYPALVRSRRFWGYTLCMVFSTGTFYVFITGVPLAASAAFGLSAATLGFYMGTITVGFAFGSFLSGRLARRFEFSTMMIAGRIVALCGLTGGLLLFAFGQVSVFSLFGATIFAGLGNGLTMPSANAGAMSLRPQLAGSAAGLAGATTVAGGAALTSIVGAIITTEHGVWQLLGAMLVCVVAGLAAAVYVRRVDRLELEPPPDSGS